MKSQEEGGRCVGVCVESTALGGDAGGLGKDGAGAGAQLPTQPECGVSPLCGVSWSGDGKPGSRPWQLRSGLMNSLAQL